METSGALYVPDKTSGILPSTLQTAVVSPVFALAILAKASNSRALC